MSIELKDISKKFGDTTAVDRVSFSVKDGELVALDAKVTFDDNGLFRHKDVQDLRDVSEEDAMELEASQHELNYIKLDGEIGCMVNGAGLAMSTMDIIKLYGEEPANFLDVGGGATKVRVTAAFKLLLSDPKVEGVLVSIVYSVVVTLMLLILVEKTFGFRMRQEDEKAGMDHALHGEHGYGLLDLS